MKYFILLLVFTSGIIYIAMVISQLIGWIIYKDEGRDIPSSAYVTVFTIVMFFVLIISLINAKINC